MIKYTPKEIKDNVNISQLPAWKDFLELVIKTAGLLLIIYIVLGIMVEVIAPKVPLSLEKRLGRLFLEQLATKGYTEQEDLKVILERLVSQGNNLPRFNYRVYVKETPDLNALALPAGNILIFRGLLEGLGSEKELAMVLAHELGHYAYRDHLKGLGRNLIFLILSVSLFGADSSVSRFISSSLMSAEMRFSQAQERRADFFALDLVYKIYGDVEGALGFYEKISQKEKLPSFLYFFSTHPYPKSRLEALKKQIQLKGYNR